MSNAMNSFVMDSAIFFLGAIIIASHIWSLKYHFDMPVMPPGVRVISTLVILSAIHLTFLTYQFHQPFLAQLTGFAIMGLSLALFIAAIRESRRSQLLAAFDEGLPHCVLNQGPYAYVRHPFYVSYLLLWSGWGIATWNIWGVVPLVAMGTTYWIAARDEEAKFTNTVFAGEYASYKSRTGMFVPRLWW